MLNETWSSFLEIEDAEMGMEEQEVPEYLCREADTVLAACVNELGRMDMPWMEKASGLRTAELANALQGAVFQDAEVYDETQDPEQGWLLRDQYLTGNVREKLERTQKLDQKYHGRFAANLEALESILPEKVPFEEIGFGLGSPWIPANFYALFMKEILQIRGAPPVIEYSPLLHMWKVFPPAQFPPKTIGNSYTYGTMKISALEILEKTLNASTIRIKKVVSCPTAKSGIRQVLDEKETLAAQGKQELLEKSFQRWVAGDTERKYAVEDLYNEMLASHVGGHYDGSFLQLRDLNPAFSPYQHQKNAVARMVLCKDVLLNHNVGSGKTACLVMGLHERKRMGLSGKNLAVVPNAVLDAFEKAHREMYPRDKILVIYPRDFSPDKRRAALDKLRAGDYTAVYMAHSSFDAIGISQAWRIAEQKRMLRKARAEVAAADSCWEARRMKTQVEKMEKTLKKMELEIQPEDQVFFDELGIDTLAIDEAHQYKNISLDAHAEGSVGFRAHGSKKADSLLEKVDFLRENGGAVIFSTGTPMTNSIADLYVIQRYLQPEQLRLLNMDTFDRWLQAFATRQTGLEVDLDGQHFRTVTRISGFHNLQELMNLLTMVADCYCGEDGVVDLPVCDGYIDTVLERSPEQAAYIAELSHRLDRLRGRSLENDRGDNLLKVTCDGRAAALDIRLASPEVQPAPHTTKAFACANSVYRYWKAYPGTAQLIFCDLGTPKASFNLYDEVKDHLMQLGVPAEEIAFVHGAATEAQRRKLFQAVNDASVRVLMGSTEKLGTGVNVQEKLIAVHHLDVPWRPADLSQRDGRLIRQGNRNKQVYRFRYITKGTFDAYSWQILENKQRFIGEFLDGTMLGRSETGDIDGTMLSYAELKALAVGNPLLRARMETANALKRTRIKAGQRDQELQRLTALIESGPEKLAQFRKQIRHLQTDQAHYTKRRESFSREERDGFGEELLLALGQSRTAGQRFDEVHGFKVVLPAFMREERPYVQLIGKSGTQYDVDMRKAKAGGCLQRIEYALSGLERRIENVERNITDLQVQITQARLELAKGNPIRDEAAQLNRALLKLDEALTRAAEAEQQDKKGR